jgi:hypothetical protein
MKCLYSLCIWIVYTDRVYGSCIRIVYTYICVLLPFFLSSFLYNFIICLRLLQMDITSTTARSPCATSTVCGSIFQFAKLIVERVRSDASMDAMLFS